MTTTCTIKLPSWTAADRTDSDQLPPGSKYPIAYADVEYIQWRGGRMISQLFNGYHFRMQLREWDLEKALELEIAIRRPVMLLYYGFKGHSNCVHRQSRTRISLLPGQYGLIHLTVGNYTLTVNNGQTIAFLFVIDPRFLEWLSDHNKGFSILSDHSENSLDFFKFPFCNIDFTVGRIIRQLKILQDTQQPTSPTLSEKLVTLIMQYQKQLVSLKDRRQETAVEKVERIKSFIAGDISKNPLPSIPEISRMFAIGQRTLRRSFKNQTGMSLNDYIYRARMEEGLKQLKAKASVTEVSQNLGYGSVAAFSKSFTKYYGFPPENIIKN